MKLVVVIFALTVTSLTVFKTFVHGKMFNCKMTEEPTMGTPGAQAGYINDDRDLGIVRIEITDRDTGTQMTTGTPGHREYK